VEIVAEALSVPTASLTVLQWGSHAEVVRIDREWRQIWIGDRARRDELIRAAARRVEDEGFAASTAAAARRARERDDLRRRMAALALARPDSPLARPWPGLLEWYRAMARSWLDVEPSPRRRLVLGTHEWIAEHLMAPSSAPAEILYDLYPVLLRCVPDEPDPWRPWIRLVTDDLVSAAGVRPPHRDEAWARRLFLIPYSLPSPRPITLADAAAEDEVQPRRGSWWSETARLARAAGPRSLLVLLLGAPGWF
jgi:hypothetical protein